MNRTLSVDYEVVNRRGVVLFTTSDPLIARREARRLGALHEEVKVEMVTLTQTRTRFFRPKPPSPASDLRIPPCPVVNLGMRA